MPRVVPEGLLRRMVEDLPADGVGIEVVRRGSEQLQDALSQIPTYLGTARDAFREFHVESDRRTAIVWTIQRREAVKGMDAAGLHQATWRTVRQDRASKYAVIAAAMAVDDLTSRGDEEEVAPVWAYTSRPFEQTRTLELNEWVCDSACGDGTPAAQCRRTHVPPGHVALAMKVQWSEVIPMSWRRWDFAMTGAYIPADSIDALWFREMFEAEGGRDESGEWSWDLRMLARASTVRCIAVSPHMPGVTYRLDEPQVFTRGQVALPGLRKDQVVARQDGPNVDRDAWWDAAVATNPEMAKWRRQQTLPVDELHLPRREGDSV